MCGRWGRKGHHLRNRSISRRRNQRYKMYARSIWDGKKYLEKNNILFEQEKWFSDCRDVKPLPFDFYLPDYNTIIEFDGEQHYKQGHFTHSHLSYTQAHDVIKNEYCKNNNIRLIRIPYWNINNIEEILENKLLISHKDIVCSHMKVWGVNS